MTVLLLIALGWLGLRTLLLLAQVARHSPEAQLARSLSESWLSEDCRQRGSPERESPEQRRCSAPTGSPPCLYPPDPIEV